MRDLMRTLALVVCTAVAGAFVFGQPAVAADCPATSEEENLGIALRYMHAFAEGDLKTLDALLHDDFAHDMSRGGIEVANTSGNQDELAFFQGPVDVDIHDVFASGDKVVLRFGYRVSHTAVAGAKSGAEAEVSAIAIARIECGQIAQLWHEHDTLGLLMAMGMTLQPAQ